MNKKIVALIIMSVFIIGSINAAAINLETKNISKVNIERNKLGQVNLNTDFYDKVYITGADASDVTLDTPNDNSLEVYVTLNIEKCFVGYGIYVCIKDGDKVLNSVDTSELGETEISATLNNLNDGDEKQMKIFAKLKYLSVECEKDTHDKELRMYYPWAHLDEEYTSDSVSGSARKGEIAQTSFTIHNDGLGGSLSWDTEIVDGDDKITIETSSGSLGYGNYKTIYVTREITQRNGYYSSTVKVYNTDTRKYEDNSVEIYVSFQCEKGKVKTFDYYSMFKERFPVIFNLLTSLVE